MPKQSFKNKVTQLQRFTPALWIIGGVLFLLSNVFAEERNQTFTGVGVMFIILGITFASQQKSSQDSTKKDTKND